jgi:hypothetical protein
MIFERHSNLMDRTNRSAYAFRFGLRAGSLTVFTPPDCKTRVKMAVNKGSRSWIRYAFALVDLESFRGQSSR